MEPDISNSSSTVTRTRNKINLLEEFHETVMSCTACMHGVGASNVRSALETSCTDIVLIFLDSEFDHVLGLLQDVHGVLHGAVLQTHTVDGQQPVSRLQGACSAQHNNKGMTIIKWVQRAASPDSLLRILLSWHPSWVHEGDPNLSLHLIDTEPFLK